MRVYQALGLLERHIRTYFDHFPVVLPGVRIQLEMGLRGVGLVLARYFRVLSLFLGGFWTDG